LSSLQADVIFRREVTPVQQFTVSQYEGPNGKIMDVIQGEAPNKDTKVKFNLYGRFGRKEKPKE
jgi:hypothetical protein